jgi:hypothetical protein
MLFIDSQSLKSVFFFFPEWIETQADILEKEGMLTDGDVNPKAAMAHAQEKFMDYQGVRPNSSLLSMPANERTVRTCVGDVCSVVASVVPSVVIVLVFCPGTQRRVSFRNTH